MNNSAKKLAQIIREGSPSKTESYDTQGTVKRIDGKTAWIRLNGGVDETPVQLTIDCKAGDTVQVRVGGGTAWITGNSTAPPTDDKKANEALQSVKTYSKAVEKQLSELSDEMSGMADDLSEDIEDVEEIAVIALTSANGKNTIYHSSVQPSGGDYKENDVWFDSAHDYAMYKWSGTAWVKEQFGNEAIKDLAITNAKIANATISDAKISTIDAGKITSGVIDSARINTSAITIGESQVTGLTSDLAGKASTSACADAATKATSFITQITGGGIKVHDSGNVDTNYAKITSDGMEVYKNGSRVAKFGSTIYLGNRDGDALFATVSSGQIYICKANGTSADTIVAQFGAFSGSIRLDAQGGYGLYIGDVTFDGSVSGITASMVGAQPAGTVPSHSHDELTNGTRTVVINDGYFRPTVNQVVDCGSGQNQWDEVNCRKCNESSDGKAKDTIEDIDFAEQFIMSLKPITFKTKGGRHQRTHMGFIAQEVAEIGKELGKDLSLYTAAYLDESKKYEGEDTDDNDLVWSLAYSQFIAPLVKVVQEQNRRITALEQTVAQLKEAINATD